MRFEELGLSGAFVVEPEPHADERGFFARTWCRDEFAEHGLSIEVAQCSTSYNEHAGTLRGLHFQRAPYEEEKLVRCVRGAILDVVVDLRPDSPTHCSWVGVELDEESRRALYVPKGFAHGFQTLTDAAEVLYMISRPYVPEVSDGVRWDDPAFGIQWPETEARVISPKDLAWLDYSSSRSTSP